MIRRLSLVPMWRQPTAFLAVKGNGALKEIQEVDFK
jgi:hypothetical protein